MPVGAALAHVNVPVPPVALKPEPLGRLLAVRVIASPFGSLAVTVNESALLNATLLSPIGWMTGGKLALPVPNNSSLR